jgi:cytidyltransferase-like protein
MELLSLKDFITEDTGAKHHVLTYGRMNPPTTGHLALIKKVHDVADKHEAGHTVVTSHSHDKKKNPLSPEQKLKHLKRFSPKTNIKASSAEHPTILHHAADLHKKGVTHLHVVVGSDRKKEMTTLLNRYNNKKAGHGHYNFKKITVHSAGHRDPDSEGTSGVSGTKQREHAKSGNFHEFRKGVPEHVSDKHAKELMHDVQQGSK